MPFWLSPAGWWSSPTATAATGSSYYSLLGTNTTTLTTATTTGSHTHAIWYTDQLQNQGTVAWSHAQSATHWGGLTNDPQEALYLHQLEGWTRMEARRRLYSPAIRRGAAARVERYEREIAEARERNAAAALERQHATIQAHSDEAKKRALDLLLEHLTPAQRETFHKNSWFIVEGRSMRRYRVNARGSLAGNVDVLDSNMKTIHRLCAHCDIHSIPLGDQLLAQKLMLEFDEETFLRIANRHAA